MYSSARSRDCSFQWKLQVVHLYALATAAASHYTRSPWAHDTNTSASSHEVMPS